MDLEKSVSSISAIDLRGFSSVELPVNNLANFLSKTCDHLHGIGSARLLMIATDCKALHHLFQRLETEL